LLQDNFRIPVSFYSKFKSKLRTIPASTEEQSLKFLVRIVNKAAVNAAQLANCILLHAYSCTTAAPSCASTNNNYM